MAAFLYRAVDPNGRKHRGVLEAASASSARQVLRERNLLPVSVQATSNKKGAQAAGSQTPSSLLARLRPAMGVRALALVTRQLSTLVGSDVRVEEALRTVSQQNVSPRAASVLLNVRAAILDGRSFASALGDHPQIFPEFYRASVAAGEQSGRLDAVMSHLAEFVESRQQNRQKIQLALIYPTLLGLIALAVIILLLTFVVPDIARVFVNRGAELPLLTRALIALSEGVRAYGWVVLLLAAGVGVAVRQWLGRPANRLAWHGFLARRAPTATFSRQLNSAQFAGTLATLVQSGVPLLQALKAAGAVTPNRYIRGRIETATARVSEGASLRNALAEADCFPPMLIAMVASGEAGGDLGPALDRAARDQQRELDAWVTTLVSLVEPGVLLFMGVIVLLLVMSILLPIINLNNLAGMT